MTAFQVLLSTPDLLKENLEKDPKFKTPWIPINAPLESALNRSVYSFSEGAPETTILIPPKKNTAAGLRKDLPRRGGDGICLEGRSEARDRQ